MKNKIHVITGGPGIGKTTVIDIIESRGIKILPEMARVIITRELAKKDSKLLPNKDIVAFQEAVADAHLKQEALLTEDAFSDRGIIDGVGYCRISNIEIPETVLELEKGHYSSVFLLDPLPNYQNDDARFEDSELAKRIHDEIERAYVEFEYDVIKVPVSPPEERVDFILDHI